MQPQSPYGPAGPGPQPGPLPNPQTPGLPPVVVPGGPPPQQPYGAPQPVYGPPAPQPQQPDYSFITEPSKASRRPMVFTGGGSKAQRIGIIAGILLVILFLFVIVSKLLTGSDTTTPLLISVAQHQQRVIHIATAATRQQGISDVNANSALTITTGLTTAQKGLLTYLKTNHHPVPVKTLGLTISTTIDTQLTAAAAAGTYDSTYKSIMQNELTSYAQALKQAYAKTTGPKGKQLLSSDYSSAQLLLMQLSTTN